MISISIGMACIGFVLVSLSMSRHYTQVRLNKDGYLRFRMPNRIAGLGLVVSSVVPAASAYGFEIGLVAWLSVLAAVAFLQSMLLAYLPGQVPLLGGAGMALVLGGYFL